jgi:hypothetical protein
VIAAVWARVPAPASTPEPLVPDDPRLVDLVRLTKSGISESIVAEQVKQDGRPLRTLRQRSSLSQTE